MNSVCDMGAMPVCGSSHEPFEIRVLPATIESIIARVRAYDWHEMPHVVPGGDRWAYGCDRSYLQDFCAYWTDRYDWSAAQAQLNDVPQFKAVIDGLEIHFVWVRGSGRDGRALVLTHGWPGSVFEFYGVIDRLAHPQRHGGTAEDGVDVVVPSLPGYGFSGKPPFPFGPKRIASMWDRLMREALHYDRYVAQGGDWGAIISGRLGLDHAIAGGGGCEAVHLNMYGMRPAVIAETADERAWEQRIARFRAHESAYSLLQATKPQTLSYGMMDSPVGTAAWILEKFNTWSDTRGADGTLNIETVFSKDQLLTNIMIYLVTRSFNTATWIYRGRADEGGSDLPPGRKVSVPTGVANFPKEIICFPPRRMVEAGYNVVHWSNFDRGGHFAAFETGPVFADDVTSFVRKVRSLHG